MKLKKALLSVAICCVSLLVACGNDSNEMESSQDSVQLYTTEESDAGMEEFSLSLDNVESEQDSVALREAAIPDNEKMINNVERKVVYTANIHIEVKSYQTTFNHIQEQVEKLQGYIVESSMFEDPENSSKHGQLTVRIPVESFSEFVQIVEEGSSKVLESSTSGQDVTEEYVDLESRLNAKRVVEERLLSFMEEAEKTEDLLKISNDLAKVQEDIEEITGRMKYLENKSDLATVSIYMQENNITLSGTGKDDLNTWERTKEQFMKSINFMIHAFSSIFILLVGNLPIFLVIGIVGLVIFLYVRKKIKKRTENRE